jgi:hypothetical protein
MSPRSKAILEQDYRIRCVAVYAATQGGMVPARRSEVDRRFRQFKRGIQVGEYDLQWIEDRIYSLFS